MDPKNNPNQNNNSQNRPGGGGMRYGNQQGGGFHGRGGGPGGRPNFRQNVEPSEFFEKVVQVNRVSKKTKGGDIRSLSVIVVAGDRKGRVGVGLGKARDVQTAVKKATLAAKKFMITIPLVEERTIPHDVYIKLGAAKIIMKPAPKGTGVIAGGAVRVVVEAAGVKDIVSKVLGTNNKASNIYAALDALKKLQVRKSKVMRESKESGESKEEPKDVKAKKEAKVKKEKKGDSKS